MNHLSKIRLQNECWMLHPSRMHVFLFDPQNLKRSVVMKISALKMYLETKDLKTGRKCGSFWKYILWVTSFSKIPKLTLFHKLSVWSALGSKIGIDRFELFPWRGFSHFYAFLSSVYAVFTTKRKFEFISSIQTISRKAQIAIQFLFLVDSEALNKFELCFRLRDFMNFMDLHWL